MRLLRRFLAVLLMVGFDAAGFAGCYVLAYVLRRTVMMDVFPSLAVPLSFDMFVQRYYLLLVYLLVFAYEGLYTKRLVFAEEMRRILRGTTLAAVLVTLALYVTGTYVLSRSIVLLVWALGFIVIPVMRAVAKQIVIGLRLWSKSVIIIGQDRNTQVLMTELARNWRLGYRAVAVLDPGVLSNRDGSALHDLLHQHRAESFVLSDASVGRDVATRFLRSQDAPGEEMIILLDSAALQSLGVEVEQLESLLLMKYRYNLLQPVNVLLKRVSELALTLLLLVVLMPLFALLALIVKLGSFGPVLFAQERIGRRRRQFQCLKFRTMILDAERHLEDILAENPKAREEWTKYSRITNDPRVTRAGRFLRRFSLDEFPQLANVLRGEMSLVGPRPYMPTELEKIGSSIDVIARVRPGITGPFQTSGRKELTFEERLLLDEHYVKNWSLWMDLVILLRTVGVVLRGTGAL
jgi:undecaprenyl-phosphate galactose phosphotransferase